MKQTALVKLLLFTIVISIGAVGCSRNPTAMTPIPGQGPDTSGNEPGIEGTSPLVDDDVDPSGLAPAEQLSPEDADRDAEFFSANTVYFAFDSSEVGPDQLSNIEYVANYLKDNPSHAVMIEGHCDERGTEEYNRALGERRAIAVRETMAFQFDVDPNSVHTISHGEDIPAVDGQNEDAWSLNRRGEFILLTPKN